MRFIYVVVDMVQICTILRISFKFKDPTITTPNHGYKQLIHLVIVLDDTPALLPTPSTFLFCFFLNFKLLHFSLKKCSICHLVIKIIGLVRLNLSARLINYGILFFLLQQNIINRLISCKNNRPRIARNRWVYLLILGPF